MTQSKKTITYIVFGAFILYLMVHYWGTASGIVVLAFQAASPLIYGCVLAYIVNILMNFYECKLLRGRKKNKNRLNRLRRPAALLLAYASILIILSLVLYLVISELFACISTLLQRVPASLLEFNVDQWLTELFPDLNLNLNLQQKILDAIQSLSNHLNDILNGVMEWASSMVSVVTHSFVAVIFSVYLLASKEKISGQVRHLGRLIVKKEVLRKKMNYVLEVLNQSFHKFIVGQSVEACILGGLCAIGMLILRLPYAEMIGTMIGFTALIPILGAYIGAGIGALMIATVDPMRALVFLIFITVLQQIEGNLIYPKVVGSSIGLPGVWVFAAITVGGGVFGIPGMLLGVPLAAAVYKLLKDYGAAMHTAAKKVEN